MKLCRKCKQELPFKQFWKHKSSKDGLCGACKTCMSKEAKLNRASMRWRAKTEYNLSLEEYDSIMSATPTCPICGEPTQHLDHNKETGQIRSPLCQCCNHGLGLFKHDEKILKNAADYIRRWSE